MSPERDLAAEFAAGNVRGLARAIKLVERRDPSVRHLLESLGERVRRPYVLGFTGAPGTGPRGWARRSEMRGW